MKLLPCTTVSLCPREDVGNERTEIFVSVMQACVDLSEVLNYLQYSAYLQVYETMGDTASQAVIKKLARSSNRQQTVASLPSRQHCLACREGEKNRK